MTSRGRVFVIGSTNTDLVVHCTHLPKPGETVLGDELRTFSGGKGANQAVAAARAGADVHFIGAFGKDSFGEARRAGIEREGVDCTACRTKNSASGVALIAVGGKTAHAENVIVVAPGANALLSRDDIKQALPKLSPADVVLCSLEVPLDAVICALEAGTNAGATTILNPAPFPRNGLPRTLLQNCDVLTPNQAEFQTMVGARLGSLPALKRARMLLAPRQSRRERLIVVTRGKFGVALYRGSGFIENFVRAPKVRPVDTVGAGDCFSGALAAALVRFSGDFELAAKFATAAASIKVTRHGAQEGMPHLKEIEARKK